jgi:hypothetical protein
LANVPAVPEGGVSLPGGTKSAVRRVLRVAAALLVYEPQDAQLYAAWGPREVSGRLIACDTGLPQ